MSLSKDVKMRGFLSLLDDVLVGHKLHGLDVLKQKFKNLGGVLEHWDLLNHVVVQVLPHLVLQTRRQHLHQAI